MTSPSRSVVGRREQAQAETRSAILASAEHHFLINGYQRASLDDIAETAGYSKGAIYSNFESKEALFLAVSTTRGDRVGAPLLDALRAEGDVETKLDTFGQWLRQMSSQDNEWILVETEFALVAHRIPGMTDALRDQYLRNRQSIADVIAEQAAALGIEPVLDPDLVAEAMMALETGLALSHAIDPQVASNHFLAIFRALIGVPGPTG